MDKVLRHRIARGLRLAVTWAVAFHGSLTPWAIEALYAQSTDTILLGVTPTSTKPPAAITDLLASANPTVQGQISLSWTAPQGNAGSTPIPNWPVAAYSVQFATFGVADVGGSTTTWWNATASSNQLLQPPAFIPGVPGQLEFYPLTGLIPGARYYFAVKSISQGGIFSPIDVFANLPGQQASAVATQLTIGTGTPKRPNGLSMTLSAGQFTFRWHPVTLDVSGQPISIGKYTVYRYDTIGSSATIAFNLPATATLFTDTVGGLTYFYRVIAVASSGIQSPYSDYVDSSRDTNRYALDPSSLETRTVIPGNLARELNAGFNGMSDDYEILALHQPQNENTTTMKSYLFQVQNARTGQVIPNFSFSEAIAQVQLSYALGSGGVIGFQSSFTSGANEGAQAQAIAQLISLYWYNGATFIRLGSTVLVQNQALSVSAKNLGLYEIRAVSAPTRFGLTRGSPYPRVITPNDASQNNRVFWFFDNPTDDAVSGTIYDIRGAKVRELTVNSQSLSANSIVWDGRDMNGAVVPSGVYLYKIQAGKEKATGTVVVAR